MMMMWVKMTKVHYIPSARSPSFHPARSVMKETCSLKLIQIYISTLGNPSHNVLHNVDPYWKCATFTRRLVSILEKFFDLHETQKFKSFLRKSSTEFWTQQKAHLYMQDVCSSPRAQLDNAEYQQRAIAAWSTPAWLLSEGLRNSPENSMCRIMIMGTNCLYQRRFSPLPSLCQAQKKQTALMSDIITC